jgi:hypothetical protein
MKCAIAQNMSRDIRRQEHLKKLLPQIQPLHPRDLSVKNILPTVTQLE